jgi:hypothetical protein
MSPEALIIAKPRFITAYVQEFRERKSILSLIRALLLVIKQQRILELLYGVYCNLFHPPSLVSPCDNEAELISILNQMNGFVHQKTLSRERLIELYGAAFQVGLLPDDFQGARYESICQDDECLIIGEYGESSRVAYVTPESCVMSDHYQQVPGVRHIHSIERYEDSGQFLVATGDTSKFLDLWSAANGRISFVKRLDQHLAGFTAAVRINGEYYFGTDFSSRPNFIRTLGGTKYFFPKKAYRLHVTHFYAFFDRYIASMNTELTIAGGRKTLSVFDTVKRRFIACDYWTAREIRPLKWAA